MFNFASPTVQKSKSRKTIPGIINNLEPRTHSKIQSHSVVQSCLFEWLAVTGHNLYSHAWTQKVLFRHLRLVQVCSSCCCFCFSSCSSSKRHLFNEKREWEKAWENWVDILTFVAIIFPHFSVEVYSHTLFFYCSVSICCSCFSFPFWFLSCCSCCSCLVFHVFFFFVSSFFWYIFFLLRIRVSFCACDSCLFYIFFL